MQFREGRVPNTFEPGKWADIVLGKFDGNPGSYRFDAEDLFVRGKTVEL